MNTLVSYEMIRTQIHSLFACETAVSASQARIANIERLRILAAFGIVWFHTQGTFARSVGYAGLPVFIMIFCALSAWKSEHDNFALFAVKKAQRLLIPWVFWSIVYAACKTLKHSLLGGDVSSISAGIGILVGASMHLWYLPFAFVSGLAVNLVLRHIVRASSVATIVIAAAVGILCLLVCSWIISSIQMPVPVPQWLFGLPAIPLGFAIGRISFSLQGRLRMGFCFGIILAAEAACLLLLYLGYKGLVVPYVISVALVCLAFMSKAPSNTILLAFSSLAYGVYLIHPLAGSVLRHVGLATVSPVLLAMAVFLISSLVTFILQRTPLKQFV